MQEELLLTFIFITRNKIYISIKIAKYAFTCDIPYAFVFIPPLDRPIQMHIYPLLIAKIIFFVSADSSLFPYLNLSQEFNYFMS